MKKASAMSKWNHLTDDPNGGSTGEAFFSTLNNNGYPLGDRLARESLQNSRDAVKPGEKLLAEFRFVSLVGSKKTAMVNALDLKSLAGRKDKLRIKKDCCLDHLDDDVPLRLLYVNDFNTTGLFGNPRVKSSHLRRLLLTLGDREKQREGSSSGGSYGFGKAVYSATSKIHTIVAYSRFDDNPDGSTNTRLMGCGYFPPHSVNGQDFSGRAIFGDGIHDEQNRLVIDPVTNETAHAIAEKLGFAERPEGASGSSILILDPQITANDLVRGIETWWWPALVEQAMDVVVYEESGQRIIPRPRQRADLRPFIDAFHIATGVAAPVGNYQSKPSFNKIDNASLGDAGLVMLDADIQDKGFPEDRLNTIALIRGPRMVVHYHHVGGSSPYVAGAFVASNDIEIWTKVSEPPAHDVWDASSPDLEEYGETAPKAIKAIHSRLKNQAASFRKSAMPPPTSGRRSLKVFENMFGRLFKSKNMGIPPVPAGESAPIRIEFAKQPTLSISDENEELIAFSAKFNVLLRDDFAAPEAKVKVSLDCNIVEDEDSRGDALPLMVTAEGQEIVPDNDGSYICQLAKGKKLSFDVLSTGYDPMWSVRFTPTVELLTGEDA